MATAPTLVRAYNGERGSPLRLNYAGMSSAHALPPISSFAFADVLRSADSADFQQAIDGIADICAKNRMSLADEYASHLPPLGEITAANSVVDRQQLLRPGARRALTSVPEASSSGSESSIRSKKKSPIFNFRKQPEAESKITRQIRIGSMGRTVSVGAIAALVPFDSSTSKADSEMQRSPTRPEDIRSQPLQRAQSEAAASLQRLMTSNANTRGP